jgi:hypothetical protein
VGARHQAAIAWAIQSAVAEVAGGEHGPVEGSTSLIKGEVAIALVKKVWGPLVGAWKNGFCACSHSSYEETEMVNCILLVELQLIG